MNLDMAANPARVVFDTNILISAMGFGGKPREALLLIYDEKIEGVTSPILLAELQEVVVKKFPKLMPQLPAIVQTIKEKFLVLQPKKTIHIVRDEDDNRVLEAAVEGGCNFIVTGDKELLALGKFRGIKIVNADQFLKCA